MIKLLKGDCLQVLKSLSDNSVDSLVTDPPAGIAFMNKGWDEDKGHRDLWILWLSKVMKECRRVLKPGAHGLVWAIPRTSHWTGMALENSGFEVRDVVTHLFGQGFPKSLDISKAIDKMQGAKREVVGSRPLMGGGKKMKGGNFHTCQEERKETTTYNFTAPATDEAKQWEGWGTALKPAVEFWFLIRKPIEEKSVALNVLKHGTGGINIDGSRIGTEEKLQAGRGINKTDYNSPSGYKTSNRAPYIQATQGRFPSNLVLSHNAECKLISIKTKDGSYSINEAIKGGNFGNQANQPASERKTKQATEVIEKWDCTDECAVKLLDDQSGNLGKSSGGNSTAILKNTYGIKTEAGKGKPCGFGDVGGASRFFYCAKISSGERNAGLENLSDNVMDVGNLGINKPESRANRGRTAKNTIVKNFHPTVKPIKLMRYLTRLITPSKGIVLDPFMGSGSTGIASLKEGFGFIGIEKEPEYFEICKARITQTKKLLDQINEKKESKRENLKRAFNIKTPELKELK